MNNQPKDLREDFKPEDFAIKRPRANSVDMNKKEDTKTDQMIADFVIIEDYAESLGTGLSEKEWMLAINEGNFDNIDRDQFILSL